MKKGKYEILCKNKKGTPKFVIRVIEGYIDAEKGFGVSNESLKEWVSTDLESGMIIAHGKSKKECIINTEKSLDTIKKKKEEESVIKIINSFQNAIKHSGSKT